MELEDWMPLLYRTWKRMGEAPETDQPAAPPPPRPADRIPARGKGRTGGRPGRSVPEPEVQVQGPGRAYPSEAELRRIAEAVKRLSRGFTGYRNKVGSLYLDDPDLLGAYLLYYWPISYLQARHVAKGIELGSATPGMVKILDCGSGPGPVGFALADEYLARQPAAKVQIQFLDHSQDALNLAGRLAKAAWEDGRVQTAGSVWNPQKAKDQSAMEASLGAGGWDAVGFGHSLNEFWASKPESARLRLQLLSAAARTLSPVGRVLVLEPALRESTDSLLGLRDRLVAVSHPIYAPCPWRGPCPALAAGQTCHGEVGEALPKTVQKLASLAGLAKDRVAMAYLAFGPAGAPWPPTDTLSRVVSDTMVNKSGRTRCMVCTIKGRLSLSARLPATSAELARAPAAIKTFAGLSRDQLVRIEGAEDRDGGLGVIDSTVIRVVEGPSQI